MSNTIQLSTRNTKEEEEEVLNVTNSDDDELDFSQSMAEKDRAHSRDNDPLHVDIPDQWLPCIPWLSWLSLTWATMIAAVIGIGGGLAISMSGPQTETVEVITKTTHSMAWLDMDNMTNITNVTGTSIINGEMYVFYETYNISYEEVPYVHLNPYIYAVIEFPGKIWVRALKLLALPLIILMMLVLPARVDSIGNLGKIAIPLYLLTSTCSAIQGTIWAWAIQPGNVGNASSDGIAAGSVDETGDDILVTDAIFGILYNAVPANIVVAMADLTMLGVICFFLAIGALLNHGTVTPEEKKSVLNVAQGFLRCCMLLIVWVIWFTPIGMLSLTMLKTATTADLINLLEALGWYLLCVAVGHTIHTFIFYPVLYLLTTRLNPYKHYAKIFPAALFAFGTSSSAATLPLSLEVADKAGVRKNVYSFILPLGAAINMDGTALGFPIMVALIAQLNGVTLDFGQIIVVLVLAIVISIGTAPIPNVGMVYLTMLFEAAGLGQYAGEGIATLFVLDWLVDRIETAVNVTSDQYVAKITDVIDQRSKLEDKPKCCFWCIPSQTEKAMGDQAQSKGAYQATQTEME